jgi:exopolyphosphatase/guanosine-5'-triphosphate,3'-diphosphate pyrophosphatase
MSLESVDICPWALREGVILRRLDSEADGNLGDREVRHDEPI